MKFKFGPFDFRLAEKNPTILELGATGTVIFSGDLSEEEYNSDLRGDKAITVYEKMRKSDGQVKGALLACTLPLREARWDIEPASDSARDKEIADFVRDNLFDQMTITWDDFLYHVLLMFPFGFSVFEKVWELVDGKYRWRKLAPRLPKSIYKWKLDPEGGLDGIEQFVYKDDKYNFIPIPVEKLLVFTLEKEGSNFRGTSLLRAAYKHWYYKDQLYRIDGMAAERHGIGVALFKLPPTATTEGSDSDYGKISKIGESLHAHERSYVALPSEYEFDFKGVSGQIHDTMRSIDHHDTQIVRSILAQFINLGAGDVGSYALSQDQSGFFLMALRAVAKNIRDTMNRYAIKQLVDYNWDVEKYPKLTVSGLEHRDMEKYAKAISDLVNAGVILPDIEMDAELRKFLHLPPRKKPETKPALRLREFKPKRALRGAEVYIAFKEISDRLDTAEDDFVKAAKKIQDKQIAQITNLVVGHIEKGNMERVVTIDVPLKNEMTDAIEAILLDLFEYGQQQVKDEITKQKGAVRAQDATPIPPPKELLKTRAGAVAGVLGSKLRAAMAWEAIRQVKGGVVDRAAMMAALTVLSDKELEATAKFSVSEALNLGRQTQANEQGDEIDHVEYSALMDEHTCGPCGDLDGQTFAFPSGEWDNVTPPYRNCEGQDRCRCVGVFVYRAERR